MKQTVRIAGGINELFGTLDENLKFLESSLHVTTHLKDHDMEIEGEPAQVERAARLLGAYNDRVLDGHIPTSQEVKALLHDRRRTSPSRRCMARFRPHTSARLARKASCPKSANQKRYIEALETYDMVFAIGPGGTGKTYLAVAMAVSALLSKQVNRIILARPAVEAGERLGFLPGTLQEKVDPYMRPLYDALHDLLEADKLERFLEKGIIEVAPLAFMRGRTLNDSFVILDEAQNTTSEQMKMFLTRLGFNSKAVITGDVTQIDLPDSRKSGLVEAIDVVGKIEGISFVYFDERDVVRHNLVQRIIKAYDEYTGVQRKRSQLGASRARRWRQLARRKSNPRIATRGKIPLSFGVVLRLHRASNMTTTVENWAEQIRAGDVRAISRAVSAIENRTSEAEALLRQLFPYTGRAWRVGITGAPGTGKSTLVDRLAAHYRSEKKSVGIIAVDPSSPFTGGAILGDRVRMQGHAGDEGIFIRSMATRGYLGGLAQSTGDTALLLDAAGKDMILVETVGVGQGEIEIVRLADCTIVVLVPGMGDDVQSLKAGLMEIADIFVINKSDREGAGRFEEQLRRYFANCSRSRWMETTRGSHGRHRRSRRRANWRGRSLCFAST